MKKLTAFLGVMAFAAMIFAGASSAFAAPDPLYLKVSISGKGYIVDEDNATEEKTNFKTTGYLMWLGNAYVLVSECAQAKGGWYVSSDGVNEADSGKAIYIAAEEVEFCTPYGLVLSLISARISYKLKDKEITGAMFSSLGGQIVDFELDPGIDGALVSGVSVKGKMVPFDKLPANIQDIFENIVL